MPHVVTDNCHLCRFTECVAVCPVECFHADKERIYIDPEVCIDCGACIPACPVRAIYEVIDMPDDQRRWIEVNAERARALPVVYAKQEPLPTAAARRAERLLCGGSTVTFRTLGAGGHDRAPADAVRSRAKWSCSGPSEVEAGDS